MDGGVRPTTAVPDCVHQRHQNGHESRARKSWAPQHNQKRGNGSHTTPIKGEHDSREESAAERQAVVRNGAHRLLDARSKTRKETAFSKPSTYTKAMGKHVMAPRMRAMDAASLKKHTYSAIGDHKMPDAQHADLKDFASYTTGIRRPGTRGGILEVYALARKWDTKTRYVIPTNSTLDLDRYAA